LSECILQTDDLELMIFKPMSQTILHINESFADFVDAKSFVVDQRGKELHFRRCTVSIPESALQEEVTVTLSYNYNRSDETVRSNTWQSFEQQAV